MNIVEVRAMEGGAWKLLLTVLWYGVPRIGEHVLIGEQKRKVVDVIWAPATQANGRLNQTVQVYVK